ncbi:CoA transferase, partial [Rhodospirillaceae bacterium]|nr:CoA transferase [Rhodospirillaceae bacterium]
DSKGNSLYWAGLNKGKKSIAVNARETEGRELIEAIICQPGPDNGIFLTNHPPGGPFSYNKLKSKREDLIMVNVLGSYDGSPAVDYTINCALGFPFATGPRGLDRPVNHLLPAWDLVTGCMAATGVLAAERQRSRKGNGALVKLALSDVGIWVASALGHLGEASLLNQNRVADGNHVYGAFGHDFLTSDDKRIMVTALTKAQWRRLKTATEITNRIADLQREQKLDLDDEGDRYKARDKIVALIEPWVASRDYSTIKKILDEAGVLWGPYQTFTDLVNYDERCSIKNPLIEIVEQPRIGVYPSAGLPLRFEQLENTPIKAAPVLGANTDEVLLEVLGIPEHSIADLHDRGIIGGAVTNI